MNNTQIEIENNLREKVSSEISLLEEGLNRYRVFTPFCFDDGDHFSIVLKKIGSNWLFTDEAHTLMHMSYEIDTSSLKKGTRQKIISNTLENFGMSENDGELMLQIEGENYGSAFYNYIQALTKITDISYLSKEQVRSTFYEDFKYFITETVDPNRITLDYTHPEYDKGKKYIVDCCINGMVKPIFLFAISNDSKCKDVMISMYQFERWGIKYHSVSIFEDQETINRRVLAKFSDIGDKQFSSLISNKERIQNYILESII
ncbi:MAG: DUF1828 domain-containing protein [Bacteroidetes bacterium]|nr:DUF1828 domain-containing protein [Bacteroidota bacterium]